MAALNGYYILPKPPPSSPSRRCCCFSSSPSTTFPRSSPPSSSSSSSSGPFPLLTPKHHHHPSSSSSSSVFARCHHIYSGGGRSRTKRKIHCSCSSSESDVVELPLFPLPLVLFPGAVLPLQIFEFRYRILMHTLLQTDLRFGVVFSDSGSAAGVGCVAEVIKHEGLADDRFFLVCKGQERFRVTRIVRTKPYLVGEVLWLEDRPHQRRTTSVEGEEQDGDEDPESLASEVERHMRDVIRISNRLNGKNGKKKKDKEEEEAESESESEEEEKEEKEKEEVSASMDLRKNLFPTPFSFFVGSTFEGAPREQQALLEMEDTVARLRRERDTLRNTLNYLTAASAVNDAFPSSSSSSSSS